MRSLSLIVLICLVFAIDLISSNSIAKSDEQGINSADPVQQILVFDPKQSDRMCKKRDEPCNPNWNIFGLSECCTDKEWLHCDIPKGNICADHTFSPFG